MSDKQGMPALPIDCFNTYAPIWAGILKWADAEPSDECGEIADKIDAAITELVHAYAREYAAQQTESMREQLAAAQSEITIANSVCAHCEDTGYGVDENGHLYRCPQGCSEAESVKQLHRQLAAAEADTVHLIEEALCGPVSKPLRAAIDKVMQTDRTALQSAITRACEEMRESCARVADNWGADDAADEIRTLPAEPTAAEPVMLNGLTEAETSQTAVCPDCGVDRSKSTCPSHDITQCGMRGTTGLADQADDKKGGA